MDADRRTILGSMAALFGVAVVPKAETDLEYWGRAMNAHEAELVDGYERYEPGCEFTYPSGEVLTNWEVPWSDPDRVITRG